MDKRRSMPQIISASRRTDIPAFYSAWFMDRIRAGYCTVVNPYNRSQVAYVSLRPEDVTAIVFWTRNPKPLLPFLNELNDRGYRYYFLYTIIGYPREIDPHSPSIDIAVETFQELSRQVGKARVIWRYDPMILSNLTPVDWHREQIQRLMGQLKDYTEKIIFSFVEPYRKTRARLDKETGEGFSLSPEAFSPLAYEPIVAWLAKEANAAGLAIQSCAEEISWDKYGITNGKCIDDTLISRMTGKALSLKKDTSQRKFCHCVVSKDIGATNTCLFGCRYCYATVSMAAAQKNHEQHDPSSPSLLGWHDVVKNEGLKLD